MKIQFLVSLNFLFPCATLQFTNCITCYPPVHKLYHVLPSSSLARSLKPLQFPDCITVLRATLQFIDCITCSPPVPWLEHVLVMQLVLI